MTPLPVTACYASDKNVLLLNVMQHYCLDVAAERHCSCASAVFQVVASSVHQQVTFTHSLRLLVSYIW